MKDPKFNFWKKKLIDFIDVQIKNEENKENVKKSVSFSVELLLKAMNRSHLVAKKVMVTNSKTGKTYEKTVYTNPNKEEKIDGKKIYTEESKGAKISLGKLKKQLEKCTNSTELMQIVLANKSRFSDKNGRPLPIIQEFSKYVSSLNDKLESENAGKENEVNDFENKLKDYIKNNNKNNFFDGVDVKVDKNKNVSVFIDGKKYEKRTFRYDPNAKTGKDGNKDWNESALGNLVNFARSDMGKTKKYTNADIPKLKQHYIKRAKALLEDKEENYTGKQIIDYFLNKIKGDENEKIRKMAINAASFEIANMAMANGANKKQEKTESEEHANRSNAMLGNDNAKKDFTEEKPKPKQRAYYEKVVEPYSSNEETKGNYHFIPKGNSSWGTVYEMKDASILDACKFLMEQKDGFVENVFVGKDKQGRSFNIGLCWGHSGLGLKKIIEKHIIEQSDFETVEQAIKAIQNVLENGKKEKESNNKTVMVNGKYRLVIANENNRFVITVFDKSIENDDKERSEEEKEKKRKELNIFVPNSFTPQGTPLAETVSEKNNNIKSDNVKEEENKNPLYDYMSDKYKDNGYLINRTKQVFAKFIDEKFASGKYKSKEDVIESMKKLPSSIVKLDFINKYLRYEITKKELNELRYAEKADYPHNMYGDTVPELALLNIIKDYELKRTRKYIDSDEQFEILLDNLIQDYEKENIQNQNAQSENKNTSLSDIRKNYQNAKAVTGRKKTVTLPNGERIKCHYKLVEAQTPTASHDETTFSPTQGFPQNENGQNINDRDYFHDKDAQESVRRIAQDFNSLALEQPPILTKDGIVISGNNRTMSSKLAAKNGTDKAYLQSLKDDIEEFGLEESDLENFKNPRIVLEVDEEHSGNYTTEEFAMFNKDTKKTMNNVEKAVKLTKTLTENSISSIAEKLENYETMSELYQDKKGSLDFVQSLVNAGIILDNEKAQYLTSDGLLNDTGKDFVETVLVGSVLNEENIRACDGAGGKKIRQKLVRAILPLIENKGNGKEYSFNNELNEAVAIALKVSKNHNQFATVKDFLMQESLFDDKKVDAITAKLAEIIHDESEKAFASRMKGLGAGLRDSANGVMDIFLGDVESKESLMKTFLDLKKSISNLLAKMAYKETFIKNTVAKVLQELA